MATGVLHISYPNYTEFAITISTYSDNYNKSTTPLTGTASGDMDDFLPSQAETGVKARHVDYTLYERMHISLPDEPTDTSVIRNILAGDEDVDFLIWNAHRTIAQTINSYNFDSGVDGVLVEVLTVPTSVSRLGSATGNYALSTVGGFIVDGYITWDTNSNDLTTYFNFIRGLVTPFMPKKGTYKESELYTTNIFISGNNTEKRIALQDTHKFMFDYIAQVVPKEKIQALSNLTRLNVERTMLHPVWSSSAIITNVAGAVVSCDTTYRDFSTFVLLFNDDDNYEIGTISSKNDSSITLVDVPTGSFGNGDLIMPLKASTIDKQVRSNLKAYNNAEFDIKAEELYLLTAYNGTPDSYPTYLTYDIFNDRPEYVPSFIHNNNYQILGKSYNSRIKYRFSEQEEIIEYKYFLKSETEIYNFRNFFRDKKGRFGKFWLPSWKIDFTLENAATTGSTALNVTGLNAKFQTHLTRHIFIAPNFYAKVNSYTLVDDDTVTLNLSTGITSDLPVGTTISNLYFVRFDQDELTILYNNIDFTNAEITVRFKELQPETP